MFLINIFILLVYIFAEEQLALIKEYQSANKETKLKMEQRYGKSLLTSLLENHMSETWIHDNSKPCPNCNTAIEVRNCVCACV